MVAAWGPLAAGLAVAGAPGADVWAAALNTMLKALPTTMIFSEERRTYMGWAP